MPTATPATFPHEPPSSGSTSIQSVSAKSGCEEELAASSTSGTGGNDVPGVQAASAASPRTPRPARVLRKSVHFMFPSPDFRVVELPRYQPKLRLTCLQLDKRANPSRSAIRTGHYSPFM